MLSLLFIITKYISVSIIILFNNLLVCGSFGAHMHMTFAAGFGEILGN